MLKAKVRKPWKKTRTYTRLTKLSDAAARAVSISLVDGIKKFKSKVDPQKIYEAWLSGDYSKVYEQIPWEKLYKDIEPAHEKLAASVSGSAKHVIESLPPDAKNGLRWDTSNPTITRYVDSRIGELVVGIQEDTREVIAGAISRSLDNAMTPRRVADLIKPSIGLYPQQVTALDNYRQSLIQQGGKSSVIEAMSSAYEARLLDYRAMMIARTEVRRAHNQGQLAVWNTAKNQGVLDRDAKKAWVVDGNPCPECIDLDGEIVGIDEFWETEDGPVDAPPLHPNCMCGMELVYNQEEA